MVITYREYRVMPVRGHCSLREHITVLVGRRPSQHTLLKHRCLPSRRSQDKTRKAEETGLPAAGRYRVGEGAGRGGSCCSEDRDEGPC